MSCSGGKTYADSDQGVQGAFAILWKAAPSETSAKGYLLL
jgi:hypothetical protein